VDVNRRSTLAALLAVAATGQAQAQGAVSWPAQAPLGAAEPFSFERLKGQARALAARPYRP